MAVIEILVFAGCPHREPTLALARDVAARLGVAGHHIGRPKGRRNVKTILAEKLRLAADTREKILALHGIPDGVIADDATNEELFGSCGSGADFRAMATLGAT